MLTTEDVKTRDLSLVEIIRLSSLKDTDDSASVRTTLNRIQGIALESLIGACAPGSSKSEHHTKKTSFKKKPGPKPKAKVQAEAQDN